MRSEIAGRVGPNAILQTAAALRDLLGLAIEHAVCDRAGLARYIEAPPKQMVREEEAARLFDAVRSMLAGTQADAVLAEAGRRTARYVAANRIPKPVTAWLAVLPHAVAGRILLTAIHKHAWTFAGSGVVTIERGRYMSLTIAGNPLATPGCPWHVATLEQLFGTLVSPAARVSHAACSARGDKECRFEIRLT